MSSIIGENETKLNEKDRKPMEGEITYQELSTALKNMKIPKAQIVKDSQQNSLNYFGKI